MMYSYALASEENAMADGLLDVEGAARWLGGVSRWSLYAWVNQGRLRKTKVGTRVMFKIRHLEEFVDSCNKAEARVEAHETNRKTKRRRHDSVS
jgi:hypothetical protein